MKGDAWAPYADAFLDGHYGSLRGRVRTYVIDQHLRAHLAPPPAELVDVGGGGGRQALPLLRAGYRVTIVDPSWEMLDRASALIAREPAAVRDRLTLVQAAGQDVVAAVGPARFTGVLCHGVLMYVEEPELFLEALAALAAPGGVVSIAAKNRHALAARPAHLGDWKTALAAFDGDRQVNGLGIDTRADTVEGVAEILAGHGVETVAWYGVRLFTDGWAPDRSVRDQEEDVLAVELEASRRDPYRQLSRLFHLVGVKRGGS